LGVSLKYLYTDACSVENIHRELEICVLLQTWWDDSHDQRAALLRYRL